MVLQTDRGIGRPARGSSFFYRRMEGSSEAAPLRQQFSLIVLHCPGARVAAVEIVDNWLLRRT